MVGNNPVIPNNILLSYAYVWTTGQTVRRDNLVTTTADGWIVENITAATNAVPVQVSPSFTRVGTARKTNATAASHIVKIRDNLLPVSGAAAVSGIWRLQGSINGAAFSDLFTVDTAGNIVATGGGTFNGVSIISKTASNSQPSTVDHLTLHNPAGTYSHIAFKFGSTIKSGITGSSDGSIIARMTGSSGFMFEFGGSITGTSLVTQIYSAGIYSSGVGTFGGKVSAGVASIGHSTFTNAGSFGWKGRYVSANYTLGEYDFVLLVDASQAEACVGAPSAACGSYGDSGTCGSHATAGCSWTTYYCSDYNGNQGTCEGQAGCTWETSSCGGFGDQSTCESYGGCTWANNPQDCSGFGDQGTCQSYMGCTWNTESTADCSAFNGDESTCGSTSGCSQNYSACSWNGSSCDGGGSCSGYMDEGSCNAGMYFSSCSGTYVTSPANCSGSYDSYSCSGSYATGNCTGSWGVCGGTASCTGFGTEGACEAETGCNWSEVVRIALPAIDTVFDGNKIGRPYYVQKIDSSAGVVVVDPDGSETIEGASDMSISTQYASGLFYPFRENGQCSEFLSSGACTPTGCSWIYYECSGFSTAEDCGTQGTCTWDGMSCSGQYGGYCSGTYIISKMWHKIAVR